MKDGADLGLLLYDRVSKTNSFLMSCCESDRNAAYETWPREVSCCGNWIGSLTAFGLHSASGGKVR